MFSTNYSKRRQNRLKSTVASLKSQEIIRTLTLNFANEIRKKQVKEPIDYDPRSGKFAPGGVGSAKHAVVNMKGGMAVFDKNGKRLPEWKSVTEIPRLLRVYPKYKITNT